MRYLAGKSPSSALEAATSYVRAGLTVTPCDGKKPVLPKWTERKLQAEELPELFADGRNVALVLGDPSDGLVNVDLDIPEARRISDRCLPDTLCGGREDTPRAHYYYWVRGAKTRKWQGTDGRVLLELRSTGCQTLVEPSLHPSGQLYRWDTGSALEPVEVAPEELERRCKELATATAIARHLPPVGGRHEYAKAVVGFLLRRLEKESTYEIVLAAWHAGEGDSDEAVRDLEGIIEDTGRRLSEGDNAFGGPALEEIAAGLPKLLAGWWGQQDGKRESKDGGEGSKERSRPQRRTS